MRYILILSFIVGNALPLLAAGGKQPLPDIRQAVQDRVQDAAPVGGDPWHVEVGQLDNRLHLKQCTVPLQTFMPHGEIKVGNITVGVRCNGTSPWKLYVPVSIKLFTEVVVLRQPVSVGSTLSAADLSLEKRNVSQMSQGYFRSKQAAVGKQLKRSIGVGRVLSKSAVANPALIKRGDKVILQASSPAFDVRVEAVALANAGLGERLRVRNLSSKQVVEGIVSANGRVMVRL